MKIIQKAQAGSFESSDMMVLIEPATKKGRNIEIDSVVNLHYGEQIRKLIEEKLDELNVSDVHLIIKDKGALNPTIEARIETAVTRGAGLQKGTLK